MSTAIIFGLFVVVGVGGAIFRHLRNKADQRGVLGPVASYLGGAAEVAGSRATGSLRGIATSLLMSPAATGSRCALR